MGNGYPLTQRSRSRPLFSKLAQSCNPATSYPSCKTIRLRSIHPYAREEAITAPVYPERERERDYSPPPDPPDKLEKEQPVPLPRAR